VLLPGLLSGRALPVLPEAEPEPAAPDGLPLFAGGLTVALPAPLLPTEPVPPTEPVLPPVLPALPLFGSGAETGGIP
jgi:hypothetical protein